MASPSPQVVWVPTPQAKPTNPSADLVGEPGVDSGVDSVADSVADAGSPDPQDKVLADTALSGPDNAVAKTPPSVATGAAEPIRRLDLSASIAQSPQVGWVDPQSALTANPRHRHINAATQEHRFAAYMDAWVKKIERTGQLHYPQQARRQGLTGVLVLSVDVLPSGEVADIRVERSSGHAILDDAAREIVSLASPYAPLPIEPNELDRLTITRTWQFSSGGAFR